MDSKLKSTFVGRIGATICSLGFMFLAARYGVNISPDDQANATELIVKGLEAVSGAGAVLLPLISKLREGKQVK